MGSCDLLVLPAAWFLCRSGLGLSGVVLNRAASGNGKGEGGTAHGIYAPRFGAF